MAAISDAAPAPLLVYWELGFLWRSFTYVIFLLVDDPESNEVGVLHSCALEIGF